MKDFVSDNDPTKNIEEKNIAVPEKKPIVKFTGKAGENNYKCQNIADVHENEKPFVCSRCPSKFVNKSNLTTHIAAVHEKKKPFMCSICPTKFSFKGQLNKHIGAIHEKKKSL